MLVKLSDWLAEYLVSKGITTNFTVPGGGAMHLNSSFGNNPNIKNVFVQHEQAAAIAAEGYFRSSNKLPLVCVTTGPGGTNALTGVLGAWLDSIPMLVISGQVKFISTVASTGYPMRIYGDQEYDITKCVSAMSKYAVMVTEPRMMKFHVDKALYFAFHGRPGPVWLDVPHNVQAAMIDPDQFVEFDPCLYANMDPGPVSMKTVDLVLEKLKAAKRPVLLGGVELRTAGKYELFRQVAGTLNIPVLTSFDGIDLLENDHPLYAGRCGDHPNRYGNWAMQNADFILVIGNRMGIRQVSYATETWAREAFVCMVYEDSLELTKPNVHIELPIRADYGEFMEAILKKVEKPLPFRKQWMSIINKWKKDYPAVPKEKKEQKELINILAFFEKMSECLPEESIVMAANGVCMVIAARCLKIKKGGRYVMNSGCATMGYGLPVSIGAAFANEGKDIICLEGDGSLNMNIQELQTMVYHHLPIKMVLINNGGYHSMRQTQYSLFKDKKPVGVGPETHDLGFPEAKKIAAAYGIPYKAIKSYSQIKKGMEWLLGLEEYGMLEVYTDTVQPFEPKASAKLHPDGSMSSPPLEDLDPFLSREELEKVMIIPLVDDK